MIQWQHFLQFLRKLSRGRKQKSKEKKMKKF